LIPVAVDNETAKFNLTLIIEEGTNLSATLEYNIDLFSDATIDQFSEYYCALLRSIVTSGADQPWSALPLVSREERNALIRRTQSQCRPIEKGLCLHQMFAEQVRNHPDSVALAFGGREMTYAELDLLSDSLARFLKQNGLNRGEIVALCTEPSFQMIIGILGILKAGGAYMPIATDVPEKRLAWMLADADARFLITQEFLSDRHLPLKVNVVLLDRVLNQPSDTACTTPEINNSPDSLAYLIYTSGSTGEPKGVLVSHYNVVRLFQATEPEFRFDEQDVWTLFHSYTFDFSVWEIWGALLYGGKLIIVPFLVSRNPETFYHLLVQQRVSVLNQTPSAFRQLIKAEQDLEAAGSRESLQLRY